MGHFLEGRVPGGSVDGFNCGALVGGWALVGFDGGLAKLNWNT